MDEMLRILLTAILSGTVVSAIVGLVFKRKTEFITAEIKDEFERNMIRLKPGSNGKRKRLLNSTVR